MRNTFNTEWNHCLLCLANSHLKEINHTPFGWEAYHVHVCLNEVFTIPHLVMFILYAEFLSLKLYTFHSRTIFSYKMYNNKTVKGMYLKLFVDSGFTFRDHESFDKDLFLFQIM